MTNFEHLKKIINDDVAFTNFLSLFFGRFCDDMCPMDFVCVGTCKQAISMWLKQDYDTKCLVWENEEDRIEDFCSYGERKEQ